MRAKSLPAVLAAAGLVAACSANTPPPEQSSTSVAPTGHGGFAHCLSEHGVPAAPGPAAGSGRRSAARRRPGHLAARHGGVLDAGAWAGQLSQHRRLARVGEPPVLQLAERAVTAKCVDGPRCATSQRAALVEHDAQLLDIVCRTGQLAPISPLRSSLATANAVGRSATSASISPLLNAILASPFVL